MNPFIHLPSTSLETDPAVIYTLGPEYAITSCNAAWDAFARANGGAHLVREAVLGRCVFDFIRGPLEEFYREAFSRVFDANRLWQHEYDCSSAATFRHFAMTVYPLDGRSGLMVVNSLRVEAPQEPGLQNAAPADFRTAEGFIVLCSNCRRTRRPEVDSVWDWVPACLSTDGLPVSHGMCPPCLEYYTRMLG